jgi:hypothetical protein
VALIAAFVYFGQTGSPFAARRAAATPPAVSTALAGPTATTAQVAAIEQVIQRGDEAQMQALASRDPSPMQAVATPDYYRSMVQTNQELLDAGVVAIRLDRIDWGPITVSDTSARALAVETWTTTYADGTTEQSSDLNVYSLVQQNGEWKIEADEHPNAPAPSG